MATVKDRDLGVLVRSDMKVEDQVAAAATAASIMLGRICRAFTCLDFYTVPALYKAFVRPKMELAVQAWSPYLKKDIDKLAKVQRHATKLIPCLSHLSYEERLEKLNLTTLEESRPRGDMITVFKILNGFDKISENFLELDIGAKGTKTRGHSSKLKKHHHQTFKRQMFLSSKELYKN